MGKGSKTVSSDPVIDNAVNDNNSIVSTEPPDGATPSLQRFTDSSVRNIPWHKIYAEEHFNVREEKNYEKKDLKPLMMNIETFGLTTPLVVSEQSDGRFKIIRGHRRQAALSHIRAVDQHRVSIGELAAKDVRFQTVPCQVLKSMDRGEEILTMLDHGHIKGLNTLELFNAVEKLRVDLRYSETQIGNVLNANRGKVSAHFRMACFPKSYRDAYRDFLGKKENAVDLKVENINALYEAWNKDIKDGSFEAGGGPKFLGKWDEVVTSPKGPKENQAKIGKVLEDELTADSHPMLVSYVKAILFDSKNNPGVLGDARRAIVDALRAIYPLTVVTEEGISHEVGTGNLSE